MNYLINNNMCNVPRNYIEFYQGCHNEHLELDRLPGITFWGTKNIPITLKYIIKSLSNNDFISYIKTPLNIISDFARHPSEENSSIDIPKYLHAVWITNKDSPQAINSQLENFITQSNKLKEYQPVIWTNIEPSKLHNLNPELNSANINVRNIAELQTNYSQLLDLIRTPQDYINCTKSYKVVLIDILKYLIMESQGGILVDLNFTFKEDFKKSDLESYNFLSSYDHKGVDYLIENSFFIASKHHPIFKGTLNLIDDIMNNPNCEFVEYRMHPFSAESTFLLTMMTLSLSYTKYNNINGNKDGFQKSCGYYSPETMNEIINAFTTAIKKQAAHDEIENKLYSDNPQDFLEYAQSYRDIITYMLQHHIYEPASCSGVDIGSDEFSGSWM